MTTSADLYSILTHLSKAGTSTLTTSDSPFHNIDALTGKIVEMAHEQGMDIDPVAVAAQLEAFLQRPEHVELTAELSDAELAGVAGGTFLDDMFGNLAQFLTRLGEVSSSRGRQI